MIADLIVVANTLVLMGVISSELPSILQGLDLAILGGAVLSIVVSIWILVEMSGAGELLNTDPMNVEQRKLLKLFAITVAFFSTIVMLALAVQNLIDLGFLEFSMTMNIVLSFVLYGLLAINNSLSAALTFQPAMSGLIVLIYLLLFFMFPFVIFPVLAFLADTYMRVMYIIVDVVLWAIFTPIMAVPHGVSRAIGLFNKLLD